MSVALCAHRFPNASFCKRRAREGSRFCGYHRADEDLTSFPGQSEVNPLDRLTEITDVFAVVRETLNAARRGRIPPGQVYAVCTAVQLWLKVERKMGYHERREALESQYVCSVLDAEASSSAKGAEAQSLEPEPADEPGEDQSQAENNESLAPPAPALSQKATARRSALPRAASLVPAPLTGDALTRAVIESVLRPLRGNGKGKRKVPA
jgi:hypothetical protein